MTFPMRTRLVIPIALSLAVLGIPAVSQADAPSASAASAAFTDQKIVLQHTTPKDIAYLMHWDGDKPTLPEGVDTIQVLGAQNAFLVHGTLAGRASVVEIVKHLDIKRRQVEIKSQLFAVNIDNLTAFDTLEISMSAMQVLNKPLDDKSSASTTTLSFADGTTAKKLLDAVMHGKMNRDMPFNITTTDMNGASVSYQSQLRRITANLSDVELNPIKLTTTLGVTPRINSDNTITLAISPQVSLSDVPAPLTPRPIEPVSDPPFVPTPNPLALSTIRTVKEGETLVLGIFFDEGPQVSQTELLCFLTPTILPDKP